MGGIYATPSVEHGKTVWYVKSTDSHEVLAKGKTIGEAVKKFEERGKDKK